MGDGGIRRGTLDMGQLRLLLSRAARWPAVLAFALFISFFYVPDLWAALFAWHLYLDRLHPIFLHAAQFCARAAMGGMAGTAALLFFTFLTLLFTRPRSAYLAVEDGAAVSWWELSLVDDDVLTELATAHAASQASSRESTAAAPDPDVPMRNRWDLHPDDAPRAPLSAERDLPAGGLTAMRSDPPPPALSEPQPDPAAEQGRAAPYQPTIEDPWLQPVERSGPPSPAPHDVSLSALVMRLEARLARRRRHIAMSANPPHNSAQPAEPDPPIAAPEPPPMTVSDHSIDLALEAALSTLQRMNLRTIG